MMPCKRRHVERGAPENLVRCHAGTSEADRQDLNTLHDRGFVSRKPAFEVEARVVDEMEDIRIVPREQIIGDAGGNEHGFARRLFCDRSSLVLDEVFPASLRDRREKRVLVGIMPVDGAMINSGIVREIA